MGELGNLWVNFEGMDALDIAARLNITRKTNRDQALTRLLGHIHDLEEQRARLKVALRDIDHLAVHALRSVPVDESGLDA